MTTRHLAVLLVLVSSTARADDTPAEAKFKSGFERFKNQDYKAACPDFEESERLDPNPSTEYFLGKCAVQEHRLARAWNLFKRAAAAISDPKQRAAAEQAASDLSGQVGLVTLVGTEPAPGLEVRLDTDVVTSQVLLGLAVAVEPGPHVLRATAPGRNEWKREFTVARGEALSFAVPALPSLPEAKVPVVAVVTPPPPPRIETKVPQIETKQRNRVLGRVALATGLVGIAGGSVFGLLARNKWHDAKRGCAERDGELVDCPVGANALRDEARTRGAISTVSFIAGGASLVATTYLYLTARKERRARVVPMSSSSNLGVGLIGRF